MFIYTRYTLDCAIRFSSSASGRLYCMYFIYLKTNVIFDILFFFRFFVHV